MTTLEKRLLKLKTLKAKKGGPAFFKPYSHSVNSYCFAKGVGMAQGVTGYLCPDG